MMVPVLVVGVLEATAAPPTGTVRSWSSVDALPDFSGQQLLRLEEQLAAKLDLAPGWSLEGLGSVRDPAALAGSPSVDVLRLSGHYTGRSLAVGAGRLVRTGLQGVEPLDGTVVGVQDMGARVDAWAGQLWHPEVQSPRRLWVTGVETGWRSSQLVGLTTGLGWEARLSPEDIGHRGFGSLSMRGAKEGEVGLLAEVGSADTAPESRASLRASKPVARGVRLGANLRWEELLPAGAVGPGPLTWLAPDGLAVAEASVLADVNALRLVATGGPTFQPGRPDAGGWGQAALDVPLGGGVEVGGTALGGVAAPSSVVGGLGRVAVARDRGRAQVEAGRFRFQPLSGPVARPWEARLTGDVALVPARMAGADGTVLRGLALRSLVSVGSDRTLEPWVRVGMSLVSDFGGGGA